MEQESTRAPNNRTISLSEGETARYAPFLKKMSGPVEVAALENKVINQDLFEVIDWLPGSFVDLLFLDPPYNLTKSFNEREFRRRPAKEYSDWMESWLPRLIRTLKPTASIYMCSQWDSSAATQSVLEKYFIVRNRITWEREKGRGAATNWKNCSEDIWFCTMSDSYTFNVEAVKLKRRVIAPYRDQEGKPKGWERDGDGTYRDTHPSNLWTDITVPFWSMPENTDHPTQKPEKLVAKIILASTSPEELVLDPFLGSGTTSVVASKLGRRHVGIEIDLTYCCLAQKRLRLAEADKAIQGLEGGVFWERNALKGSARGSNGRQQNASLPLFR